jgi:hypothetical protein
MNMTRETFIDQYLDKYEQAHPDERIDYDKLREEADCAWYDREVDKGHKTEHDLTPEQEKNVKAWRKGLNGAKSQAAVDAYGKTHVKRERKPNEVKRQVIDWVRVMLEGFALNGKLDGVSVSNPERAVDFTCGGKSYTLTLTEHRPPKAKA